jgi:hypothetical protein
MGGGRKRRRGSEDSKMKRKTKREMDIMRPREEVHEVWGEKDKKGRRGRE